MRSGLATRSHPGLAGEERALAQPGLLQFGRRMCVEALKAQRTLHSLIHITLRPRWSRSVTAERARIINRQQKVLEDLLLPT